MNILRIFVLREAQVKSLKEKVKSVMELISVGLCIAIFSAASVLKIRILINKFESKRLLRLFTPRSDVKPGQGGGQSPKLEKLKCLIIIRKGMDRGGQKTESAWERVRRKQLRMEEIRASFSFSLWYTPPPAL